jgi:hypothetical protein
MKITKRQLDRLPTTRLYVDEDQWFTVPYMNATASIRLPLELKYFVPNGKGIPWSCGISNAGHAHEDLFEHPIYYIHTIGSVVYIVTMMHEGGTTPKLAIRYRHHGGKLVAAYDESRKRPSKRKTFLRLLEQHPFLVLEKGRSQAGKGAHSPGKQTGHRAVGAPKGDLNKENLKGAHARAIRARLLPPDAAFKKKAA